MNPYVYLWKFLTELILKWELIQASGVPRGGFWGVQNPLEIPTFWQSWAEIRTVKVPKIKKILLYETKFLVPNYSCLQNSWLGATAPRSPFSLSSVLNWICWTPHTKKIPGLNPPFRKEFLGTPLFQAKLCRRAKTHFSVQNIFSENRTVYEITFKIIVHPDRLQMTIWRMRRITAATNTHS
jgi:hypothetical protein